MEHENRTRAKSHLEWRGRHFVGVGLARRNPADYNIAEIGDELAAARALSDLGHQLLVMTALDIEVVTHKPVTPLRLGVAPGKGPDHDTSDTTGAFGAKAGLPRPPRGGSILAQLLMPYRGKGDVIVLGLPRGGLPVAWEVAAALNAPLDAFVVRKLGAPGHEEFAVGALASGGRVVINDDVVRGLRITPQQLRDVAEREGRELIRREAAYRAGRHPVDVAGKTVILVDDGLATGGSMFAAVQALREADPAQIVIAVPAAPESTCREFAGIVDEVVCASMPTPFLAVGESFWDFRQVTDDEVRDLLARPTRPPKTGRGSGGIGCPCDQPCSRGLSDGEPPPEALEELIGDARIVLIGESSHGRHEFYEARAAITKWLIEEKGFTAVTAEADWPDAYRVNGYVRGQGHDNSSRRRSEGSSASPRGCGATLWSATSRNGCTATMKTAEPEGNGNAVSTVWICIACTDRCRRSSPISTASTRLRQRGHGNAMPALTTPCR